MTTARTPRQLVGEDLVPLTILVPPAVKAALIALGEQEARSLSYVGRQACEAYLAAQETKA
jgi:predicted transcriptional regulator